MMVVILPLTLRSPLAMEPKIPPPGVAVTAPIAAILRAQSR